MSALRKVMPVVFAVRCFVAIWIAYVVCFVLIHGIALAQTSTEPTAEQPVASEEEAHSQINEGGQPLVDPVNAGSSEIEESAEAMPSAKNVPQSATATVPIELERRLNDLRREFLDQGIKSVDWWLATIAILGVLGGFIGFNRFREIERDARNAVGKAQDAVEKMRGVQNATQEVMRETQEAARMAALEAKKAEQEALRVVQTIRDSMNKTRKQPSEKCGELYRQF